jgi:hypothetical protein
VERFLKFGPFENLSSDQPSGWSLGLRRCGDCVQFEMYWADKPNAAHVCLKTVAEFRQMLDILGFDRHIRI